MPSWLVLVLLLVASFGAAAIGAFGQASDTPQFYAALDRPGWAPPAWLFGPVWTVLYVLIAVSAWLVWREVGWGPALAVWGLQLGLNAAWSPTFFALRNFTLALVVIVALIAAIAWTIALFAPRSTLAAWLLAPYTAWVLFATALNASLWWLNPDFR